MELPERKPAHCGAVFHRRVLAEGQDGRRKAADKAGVGDCQAQAVIRAADVVVVPFLDAPFRRLDIGAVVDPIELFRKPGLGNIARSVQKPLLRGNLMLHIKASVSVSVWRIPV